MLPATAITCWKFFSVDSGEGCQPKWGTSPGHGAVDLSGSRRHGLWAASRPRRSPRSAGRRWLRRVIGEARADECGRSPVLSARASRRSRPRARTWTTCRDGSSRAPPAISNSVSPYVDPHRPSTRGPGHDPRFGEAGAAFMTSGRRSARDSRTSSGPWRTVDADFDSHQRRDASRRRDTPHKGKAVSAAPGPSTARGSSTRIISSGVLRF